MPRTALTPVTPKGPYPGTVAADDLDFSFAAADVVNMNDFLFTGRELILVRNTDGAAAHTITLTSANDPFNRLGTIASYSVGANEFAAFWAGKLLGWDQAGGKFHLQADHVNIQFAILTIPEP